mgnify:CR=1 FL=1
MVDHKEKLRQLIEKEKWKLFRGDYEASDAEVLGILISKYFEYDGELVFQTMYSAMEDANFHTFNEQLKVLWEKHTTPGKEEILALRQQVKELSERTAALEEKQEN